MRTRSAALLAALVMFPFLSARPLAAQDIPVTAHITADNHYALYVGNEEGTSFRFVGRNEKGSYGSPGELNWSYPETWAFSATFDDYIYVVAWDEQDTSVVLSMWIGDFMASGALLVSNKTQWQSIPIPTGWPGNYGDPDVGDITAAIAAGEWQTPLVERDNMDGWKIPGVQPSAKSIWHDSFYSYTRYVVFRAPARFFFIPSCPDELAAAIAEIERLNAALAESQQELTALRASLQTLVTDLQENFQSVFFDSAFVLPGATPLSQLDALIAAIKGLPVGPKLQVYTALGSKPGH